MSEKKLKLGLPKGSLQEATRLMLEKAGWKVKFGERSYYPSIDDPEIDCIVLRSQEIPKYVERGIIDAGITGYDMIVENNSDVYEVAELIYGKQGLRPLKWVLAVKNDSPFKTIKDLEGKIIATEAVNITKKYLEKNNVKAQVDFSWGATEVKPPGLAQGIVEITETGSTLRANDLKIIGEVLETTTRFIANKESYKDNWKKQKINNLALLLKGAVEAEETAGIKMNLPKDKLNELKSITKGSKSPTISPLDDDKWISVEVVVNEKIVREIIPKLKEIGAETIIEYPIRKIIH